MIQPWKTLSSKLAFDHRWFKVQQDTVELPNGQILDDYFMWKSEDVALVVPVTSDGQFLMVYQYKHAYNGFLTEFPAGYAENREDMEASARRELLEETGYSSDHLEFLGTLNNNPTKEMGNLHIYLARDIYKVGEQQLDTTEAIELHFYSLAEVEEMIATNKIATTGSIAAFTLAHKRL